MSDEEKGGDYKVRDRRRFKMVDGEVVRTASEEEDSADGKAEIKEDSGEKAEDRQAPEKPRDEPSGKGAGGESAEGTMPAANFQSLVFSLASAAMMHLGDIADPEGKNVKDINMAKQTIDLLGILSEKTKGNLSSEEESFLSSILRDLRLRFVQAKN